MQALEQGMFPEPGYTRIGSVRAIPDVLRKLGHDPDSVLSELGVNSTLFDDSNLTIPYAFRSKLLNLCVEKTGCQHFGLLIGQAGSLSSLGWAGLMMQVAENVEAALHNLVRFFHLHARGAGVYLEERGDESFIGYSIFCHTPEARIQVEDGANALMYNFMRELCGPEFRPISVLFAHRKPVDIKPAQKFFGVPLVFDSGRNGLLFSRSWMKSAVLRSKAGLNHQIRSEINQLLQTKPLDFEGQVRRVLALAFFTHNSNAIHVASLFGITPRTMNRRLNKCSTNFKKISDQVRFEIAKQLLEDSTMEIIDITDTLNYSEVAAFSHAFKRWSGITPALWRKKHKTEY